MSKSTENTLQTWFHSSLGQALLASEKRIVDELIEGLFGYYLVQISTDHGTCFYDKSRINNKFMLIKNCAEQNVELQYILSEESELPLLPSTLDVIILHHCLDFADDPYRVLREVEQALIPGGHVVVIGFNPLSSWGICHLPWRRKKPWNARFISKNRLTDWLALLNIKITQYHSGFYGFPFKNEKIRSYCNFYENIGNRFKWKTGGFYVIVGTKQPPGVTPIIVKEEKPKFVSGAYPNPTTRNIS